MAAGSTYTPIATTTISGSSTASYTFSSIPSTYTDLELVINATSVGASDYAAYLTFNGTSGTAYSWCLKRGIGNTYTGINYVNQAYISMTTNYSLMQTPSTIKVHIHNYSNTSAYKTILGRFNQVNSTSNRTASDFAGTWRDNSAISSLSVAVGGDYFGAGSTLTLYGIAAA
jgi:hypothetical protein